MKKLKLLGKNRDWSVIVLYAFCLFLVSCAPSYVEDDNDIVVTNSGTPTSDVVINMINEVPVIYTSIPELSSKSDTIIIGKIIAAGKVINTARDVVDPAKPDPNYFSVGQIYEVQVERYLKGDENGEKTIHIVQHQGFLVDGSRHPTRSEIEKAKAESDYIQLGVNQRLLMFLNKSRYEYGEYAKGTLFVGGWHPWLFDITDTECVQPIDTLEDIYVNFPSQPLTTFIKQINEPFDPSTQPESLPYPPPEALNTCSTKSSEPYP